MQAHVAIRLGPPLPRGMPALGLVLSDADVSFAVGRRAWLAVAAPRFLILPVPAAAAPTELLQGLHRVAQATEAQALLRVDLPAGAGRAPLEALAAAVTQARLRLGGLVLARPGFEPVDASDVEAARTLFEHVRIDTVQDIATPGGIVFHSEAGRSDPGEALARAVRVVHGTVRGARGSAWAVAPCGPTELVGADSDGTAATPVFHAFAGLAAASGTTRFAAESADPAGIEVLAHRINGGLRLWIANRSARPRTVAAHGLPSGQARSRILDESSVAAAARNGQAFASAALPWNAAEPIALGPHAIAVVELEFDAMQPI